MTLTSKGKTFITNTGVTILLIISVAFVVTGFVKGQEWKADRLTEDDASWDCRTEGNQWCGDRP